jgi:hypothetical protein
MYTDPDGLWARPGQAGTASTGPNGELFGPGLSDEAVAGAFEAQFGWMGGPDYLALAQLRLEWELERIRREHGANAVLHDALVKGLYREWTAHVTGCGAGEDPLLDRALNSQEAEWLTVRQATIDVLKSSPIRGRFPADIFGLGLLEHGGRIMQVGPHMLPSMIFARSGSRRFTWRGPKLFAQQKGLDDAHLIDQYKADMLAGRWRFEADEGKIGGFRDSNGNYHIGEGCKRMNAAMEIFESTGDASYVYRLLQNGDWDYKTPPVFHPLPRR